jgi:hypothetical protein
MGTVTQCCGEQVTEQNETTCNEGKESESALLYDLATSILRECKDAAPFSDLNTAIYLFREVLGRRPLPHPLYLDSLKDLAAALATRFSFTNTREDLDEALSLFSKVRINVMERVFRTGLQMEFNVCTYIAPP